jgi:anti-sigma factor RsiW
MTASCSSVREHLGAYVDGELRPGDRSLVAAHLADCGDCQSALQSIRDLGDLLRARSAAAPEPGDLAGLAAGVISRARAEESQSWRSLLQRGMEDWHWALIGAGSLAAAVVSVLIAAAICAFGPRPARDDSLAALLNNLQTPAGTLLMIATPVGRDQVPMLMQFDNGEPAVAYSAPAVLPAGFAGPSGNDLAVALAQAVVGKDGRMSDLRTMSQRDRMQTEALLQEIQRLRAVPMASWSGRRVNIQKLGFFTNTQVTGKAL